MSAKAMCKVHTVQVLQEQTTTGSSMGKKRTYTSIGQLKCRVVPKGSSLQDQLGQTAANITHHIWTTTDPGLTERNRLQWAPPGGGAIVVMRVVGIPTNRHGQGRIWITEATTKTEDNQTPAEVE